MFTYLLTLDENIDIRQLFLFFTCSNNNSHPGVCKIGSGPHCVDRFPFDFEFRLCKHSALQNTDKTVHHLVFGPFNYAIISSFPEPGRRLVEISTVSTVISTVISTYNCNNCLYPAAAYVRRETGHPAPAAGTTLHIATVAYWRTIHNYSVSSCQFGETL